MASSLTIVLLTADRIVRADFAGKAKLKLRGLWSEASVDADVVAAVESAMWMGPNKVDRVFLLAAELWTQTLTLPVRALAGLDEEQIAHALAYEAETASGISAADSAVGFHDEGATGTERRYRLCQTSAYELNRIEEAVRRRGGRLMGVTHPAGIAGPAAVENPATRIELWPSQIAAVAPTGNDLVAADPRMMPWRTALASWLHGRDESRIDRLTCSTDLIAAEDDPADWPSLSDESTLAPWLTGCAARLIRSDPAMPVIRPAARPMTTRQRNTATALLGAFVLIACIVHYTWINQSLQRDRQTLDAAKTQVTALTHLKKQLRDAQGAADAMQRHLGSLQSQYVLRRRTREAHRRRWALLLTLLSRYCNSNIVIQQIVSRNYDVTIHGVCLEPQSANDLATHLQDALAQVGWRVQPPIKQAMLASSDGGPWSFELTAKDTAVPPQPDGDAMTGNIVADRGAQEAQP